MRGGQQSIACAAALAALCCTSAAAQQVVSSNQEVQVRVSTLTAFPRPLAGWRVRVVDGIVREVVSPRVFLLASGGPDVTLTGADRLAVVVGQGNVAVAPDAAIVVTGIVQDASAPVPDGLAAGLNAEERDALEDRPVVVATSARSVAGAELITPAR